MIRSPVQLLSSLLLGHAVCAAADAQSYTIRRLTAPGLAHGVARAIDDSFRIVGELLDASGLPQPVVWIDGVATLLPIPGGSEGSARTIDAAGRIGGVAATATTPTMATQWLPQAGGWVPHPLGIPQGGLFSGVNGLAAGGAATGFADDAVFLWPVVWTPAADECAPALLPTLPGLDQGEGMAISPSGLVVGYVANAVDAVPVTWSRLAGVWTASPLPTLGPAWGIVTAAPSDKRLLGAAVSPATGRIHFAAWTDGAITDLGALPGQDCYATCGNRRGDVAGWSRTFSSPPYVAVLVPASGPIVDLNTRLPPQTSWVLTRAHGINAAGAIVGEGFRNGFLEPFVMIPTTIRLRRPSPGIANSANTCWVTGCTPYGKVYVWVGCQGGETLFAGCLEGLDIAAPVLLGGASADAAGTASLTFSVPPGAVGVPLLLQAYEPGACHTSNVVPFTW